MLRNETKTESFFAQLLTFRHLLTRRHVGVGFVGITILAAILWVQNSSPGNSSSGSSGELGPENRLDGVRVLRVSVSPLSHQGPGHLKQRYTGIVAPHRTSRLSAKTLGRVDRVNVHIGDRVQQGDVLVQLDREQLQAERRVTAANLNAAQSVLDELNAGPRAQELQQAVARVNELDANLRLGQANLKRISTLRDTSAISAQEYDESKYRVEALSAQLRSSQEELAQLQEGTRQEQIAAQTASVQSLQAQLDQIDVRLAEQLVLAPYTGQVSIRSVDEGDVVSPGQTLLEIIESGVLEVRVGLPVEVTRQLRANSESFQITLEDSQVYASLHRMAPTIDEATRTRECVFRLDEKQPVEVVTGDAVVVSIRTDLRSQDFWVPTSALSSGHRGLWSVLLASPSRNESIGSKATHTLSARPVELLRTQGDFAEIRGPLNAGDLVVMKGTHRVVPGQAVTIATDQTATTHPDTQDPATQAPVTAENKPEKTREQAGKRRKVDASPSD